MNTYLNRWTYAYKIVYVQKYVGTYIYLFIYLYSVFTDIVYYVLHILGTDKSEIGDIFVNKGILFQVSSTQDYPRDYQYYFKILV